MLREEAIQADLQAMSTRVTVRGVIDCKLLGEIIASRPITTASYMRKKLRDART